MQRSPELPDLFIKLKFWNKDLMVSDLTQAENNQEEKWAGRLYIKHLYGLLAYCHCLKHFT